MLASCVSYATQGLQTTAAFRIPMTIQIVWGLGLGCGLYLLPESPRYLVQAGQIEPAIRALGRLHGQPIESERLQDQLVEIKANYDYECEQGQVGWRACLRGSIKDSNSHLRRIIIGSGLQMFQQLTGINFIFYYNTFFAQAGLNTAFLVATVSTIVNVVSTPLSFYTVEHYGRRPLLICGAVAMRVCQCIVGGICAAETSERSVISSHILVVSVCIYVFFFASTCGPAAWVVIGEIFPLPMRAKGVALSTASNWFWNCIIVLSVPYFVDPAHGNLGGRVFFIWGMACVPSALFVYFLVPEAKSLTLEQIDKMMEKASPRKSSAWRRGSGCAGINKMIPAGASD